MLLNKELIWKCIVLITLMFSWCHGLLNYQPWDGSRRWHWSMDDSSLPMSTNVTTVGSASPFIVDGKKLDAYHIDASHTYDLDIGSSCLYDGSCEDGYTVALWVMFGSSASSGIQTILTTGSDDADCTGILITWDRATDTVSVFAAETSREFGILSVPVTTDVWHHLVAVVDPHMPGLHLWFSGSYIGYNTTVFHVGNTGGWIDNNVRYSSIKLGVGHTGSGHFGDSNLTIDEVHIWETDATHQQIENLWTSSGRPSSNEMYMDMSYVYENNLISGDILGQVVSGNVTPVPGRYGAGLEFQPNSAVYLGHYSDCLVRPSPAVPTEQSWCEQDGSTISFWLKAEKHPDITSESIILGNTDLTDTDSGFIVSIFPYSTSYCRLKFQYRNYDTYQHQYQSCYFGEWVLYIIAYYRDVGGYYATKRDYYSTYGTSATLLYVSLYNRPTPYIFTASKPLYIGHPTRGAYFMIDELYIAGKMISPQAAALLDRYARELRVDYQVGYQSTFSAWVQQTNYPWPYGNRNRISRCANWGSCNGIYEGAIYFPGETLPVTKGVVTQSQYYSQQCEFDTECHKGFTLRLWIYQSDNKGTVEEATYLDTGGRHNSTWGTTIYYKNNKLNVVVSSRRYEWKAEIPFGFGQWLQVNVVWWANVGFKVLLDGRYYGMFTNRTRRASVELRPAGPSPTNFFIGRPSYPTVPSSNMLEKMYLGFIYYWDTTSEKLGTDKWLKNNSVRYVWSPNNTLDTLSPDGKWLNGSLPFYLEGGAQQVWRNGYFNHSVRLDGVSDVLRSDELVWQCTSNPDLCSNSRNYLLSFWVKPNDMLANPNWQTVVWIGSGVTTVLSVYHQAGTTRVAIWPRYQRCTVDITLTDNQWNWLTVYWEFTTSGLYKGSRFYVYVNSTRVADNSDLVCNNSATRPIIDHPVGYIVFGGEPSSMTPGQFHKHMAMEVDDIKHKDTFGYSYNWFDEYRHLYNVTPVDLYIAESCEQYVDIGGFPSLPNLRLCPNGNKIFKMNCTFKDETGVTETVIDLGHATMNHQTSDIQGRIPNFFTTYRYNMEIAEINTVKSQSQLCQQYISYACQPKAMLFSTTMSSSWIDVNGINRFYWAGANDAHQGSCQCGMEKTCTDPESLCNCNGNNTVVNVDDGYLRTIDRLPVRGLILEYQWPDHAEWNVGPLICQNIDPDGWRWPLESMAILETNNAKDGEFIGNQTSSVLMPGVYKLGLELDGDSGYLSFNGSLHPCMTDIQECPRGFSASIWLRMGSGTGLAVIMSNLVKTSPTQGIGFQLYTLGGALTLELRYNSNTTLLTTAISTGVWCHLAVTWKISIGAKLYINGVDLSTLGVTTTVTPDNDPSGLVPPNRLTVGSDPTTNAGRERMTLDEMWFSPHYTYSPKKVWDRKSVYLRTYNSSFESLTPPADILSTKETTFGLTGNPELVDGVVGKAIKLSPGGSLDLLYKIMHYECLGLLSLCFEGMTFNVWLKVNASVWSDGIVYTLINAVNMGATPQGFKVTTRGRQGRIDMYLEDTQQSLEIDLDIPIEKWFYFTLRWLNGSDPTVFLNGFEIPTTTNYTPTVVTPSSPPNTFLAFGWGIASPVITTPLAVDDWNFAEREYDLTEIQTLYARGKRQYYFPFEDLSSPGDLQVEFADNTSDILRIHGPVGNALYLRGPAYAKVTIPFYHECLGFPDRCINGFSLSFWLFLRPTYTAGCIVSAYSNTGKHGFRITYSTIGSDLVLYIQVGENNENKTLSTFIDARKWVHIALDYNHTTFSYVWKNGINAGYLGTASQTPGPRGDVYLAWGIDIGSGTPTNPADIAIDEFLFQETGITPTIVINRYAAGLGTNDNFYWSLDSVTTDGLFNSAPYPIKSQSATYIPMAKENGTLLNGISDYLNLGSVPGSCLTNLEFCQTLNMYMIMTFTGTDNGEQYLVSRTTEGSTQGGFYVRYSRLIPRLPLRNYFEIAVKHEGLLYSGLVNLEHNVRFQFHLQWNSSGLSVYIDKLLALTVSTGTPLAGIDERTEGSDLMIGRSYDSPTHYASMEVDEISFWDSLTITYLEEDEYKVGCYEGATMPLPSTLCTNVRMCRAFCGYLHRYAAMSSGNRCSCLVDLTPLWTVNSTQCDKTCIPPAFNDQICGSESNPLVFAIYRTTAHIPFPTPPPILGCVAQVHSHYTVPNVVNVNTSFTLEISCAQGQLIIYNYTMGDDTPTWYTDSNSTLHTYTQLGEYLGTVELRNEPSTVFVPFSILVILPTDYITGLNVTSTSIAVNNPAVINITMATGDRLQCAVDLGDGTWLTVSSLVYTSIVPISHVYTQFGVFTVTVACNNSVSQQTAFGTVNVMVELIGFSMASDWLFEIDKPMVLTWTNTTGGTLDYTAQLNGTSLVIGPMEYSHTLGVEFNKVGVYQGSIYVGNTISTYVNHVFAVEVSRRLSDITLTCPLYVRTGTNMTITASLQGSEAELGVFFPLGWDTRHLTGDFTALETYSGLYSSPGEYIVQANATNALVPTHHPASNTSCVVTVENAVSPLNMTVMEIGVFGTPLQVTLYLADPSIPATDVEIRVSMERLEDNSTVECTVLYVPAFTSVVTQCPVTIWGWFNVTAFVYNNVSSEQTHFKLPLGRPITDVLFQVMTPLVAEGQTAQVKVMIVSNSGGDVVVDFGEGISSTLSVLPSTWVTFSHVYPLYGEYHINISASNPSSMVDRTCGWCEVVQQPVSGLLLHNKILYGFGLDITKNWTVASGSHLYSQIFLDGVDVSTGAMSYYNWGEITINAAMVSLGSHVIQVTAWNNVSGPISDSLSVEVLWPVLNLTADVTENYIATNQSVNLTYSYAAGSDIYLLVTCTHAGNNTTLQSGFYNNSAGEVFISHLTFSEPGVYLLEIQATNPITTVPVVTFVQVEVQQGVVAVSPIIQSTLRHQDPIFLSLEVNQGSLPPSGSNVLCHLGDGNTRTTAHFHHNDETTYTTFHNFPADGVYNITCSVYNDISSVNFTRQVEVGERLGSLTLSVSTTLLEISTPLTVTGLMTNGSNLQVTYHFGNGVSESHSMTAGLNHQTSYLYPSPGEYAVSATVTNVFGAVTATQPGLVYVQQAIDPASVTLSTTSPIYAMDLPVEVQWTVGQGSNISCQILYQGAQVFSHNNTSNLGNHSIPGSFSPSLGTYTITMAFWNLVTPTFNKSVTIEIMLPIEGLTVAGMATEWPIRVPVTFTADLFNGSSVDIHIGYEDGYPSTSQFFVPSGSHNVSATRVFNYPGTYLVTATADSPLGHLTASTNITVLTPIYNGTLTITTSPYSTTLLILTMTLNIHDLEPSELTFNLDMGDGSTVNASSVHHYLSNTWLLEHHYSSEGVYFIQAAASNILSSWQDSQTITLGKYVAGLTLSMASTLLPAGDMVDVCFSVNQGTNVTISLSTESDTKYMPGTLEPQTSACLGFRFEPGTYTITGVAYNSLNNVSAETPEFYVEESINGLYLKMPPAAVRDYPVTIEIGYRTLGRGYCVLLDCIGANDTQKYVFGVERCEGDHPQHIYRAPVPGEETFLVTTNFTQEETIKVVAFAYNPLSSKSVSKDLEVIFCDLPKVKLNGLGQKDVHPVYYYRSETIRLDASIINTCTIPWNMTMIWTITVTPGGNESQAYVMNTTWPERPVLELPPLTFPYGLVHAHFFVKVGPYEGIQDEDDKYLQIIPTPLKVHIEGDSARAVAKGDALMIDARTGSYDPDNSNTPVKYKWFIQETNQSDWTIINNTDSGYIRRKRSLSNLDLGILYLADSLPVGQYKVKVVIGNAGRTAYFIQSLYLVNGFVFNVQIRCKMNCGPKVTTREQLSLSGECSNCNNLQVAPEWALYLVEGDTTTLISLDGSTTTGIHGASLGIKPGVLRPGQTYRVRYTVRSAVDFGLTEIQILTHLPPYGGKCKVDPDRGVAMLTKYTVSCSGWKDEGLNLKRDHNIDTLQQSELQYYFYQSPEGSTATPQLFHYGPDPVSPAGYLAMGYKAHGYHNNIVVRVSDKYGEYTEIKIKDTVVAEFYLGYNEMVDRTDGNPNEFDFHFAAKDIRSLSTSVQAFTEQLDRRGDQTCGLAATDSPEDIERRIRVRGCLLDVLVRGNDMVTTLDALTHVGTALRGLTKAQEELTERTMTVAADLVLNLTSKMVDMASQQPEYVVKASEELVHVMSDLLDASRPTTLTPVYRTEWELPLVEAKEATKKARIAAEAKLNLEKSLAKKIVYKIQGAVEGVRKANLAQKMADEESVTFRASGKVIHLQRHLPSSVENMVVTSTSMNIEIPGSGSGLLGGYTGSYVDTQALSLEKNVFTWDPSAVNVKTQVSGLKFLDPSGLEIPVQGLTGEVDMELPYRREALKGKPTHILVENIEKRDNDLVHHNISFSHPTTGILIRVEPTSPREQFQMYVSLGEQPSSSQYEQAYSLDPSNQYRVLILVPQGTQNGTYYIALRQTTRRVYRPIEYDFYGTLYSCVYWNSLQDVWSGDGCRVKLKPTSTKNSVVCGCNHLTFFGGDFFVAPNTIDFNTVFGKFANIGDNLAVLLTVIGLICMYWVGVLILRRMDKKDMIKWAVRPLLDNSPTDCHQYVMTVITGTKAGAGTTSKVSFIVVGDQGDSDVRVLQDGHRQGFERGSTQHFLVTTPYDLGDLTFIRVWHDNSGRGSKASWFLQDIIIHDLGTKERYFFVCDQWLAANRGDACVERLLPSTPHSEAAQFSRLMGRTARTEMSDSHLWFSLFSRPTRSTFTRVQRWSCCVSLLFLGMITSAMWYGRLDQEDNQGTLVKLGPFSYSTKELYIATMSALICLPVSMVIIQVFRKTRRHDDGQELSAVNVKPEAGQSHGSRGDQSMELGPVANTSHGQGSSSPYEDYIKTLYCDSIQQGPGDHRYPDSKPPRDNGHGPPTEGGCSSYKLPHCCIYIAWLLVFASIAVSGFFVVLYSVEWGKEKSEAWLTANFIGFFENVIILQPIKVIVAAAILALLFKDPLGGEEIRLYEDDILEPNQKYINKRAARSKDKSVTFDPVALEATRERRRREDQMDSSLHQIVVYTVYLIVVTLISYGQRDPKAFFVTNHITNTLITVPGDISGFSQIATLQQFETWANDILLPALNPTTRYNGDTYSDWKETWLYSLGGEYYRVGHTRLRQLRIKPNGCELFWRVRDLFDNQCNEPYSSSGEDTGQHQPGWGPGGNVTMDTEPWGYKTEKDLGTVAIWGRLATYGGGGFVFDHHPLFATAKTQQRALFGQKWLDRYTRAVATEFVVYNAHANLFGFASLLMEMSNAGVINTWWDINVLSLYNYSGNFALVRVLCEIVFVLFVCYNMYTFLRSVCKHRSQHFSGFWTYWDFGLLGTSLVTIVMYLVRFFMIRDIMGRFARDKSEPVEFYRLGLYDRVVTGFVGCLVFCSTVRMLCLLKLNKRVLLFMRVLQISGRPLLDFGFTFAIVMMAFASCAYGIFGTHLASYATFTMCIESLLAAFVGARMFSNMETEATLLGRVFFFVFICVMLFVMTNMLVSIINEAMDTVNKEMGDEINNIEFLSHIGGKIRDMIGLDNLSLWKNDTESKHSSVGLQCDLTQLPDPVSVPLATHDICSSRVLAPVDGGETQCSIISPGRDLDRLWGNYHGKDKLGKAW